MNRTLIATVTLTMACIGAMPAKAAESISATTADGRKVTVTAVTPHILRIANALPGQHPLPSQAVVLQPQAGKTATTGHTGPYITTLATEAGITAVLDNRTGFLTITAPGERTICDDGVRRLENGRTALCLTTTARGSVYGAGERGHSLNLRGDTLVMYNRQNYGYTGNDPRISQMNITMPLFVSTDGFALLFDDYARSEMIVDNSIEYITDNNRPVDYYYILGDKTLADVTEQLSSLTGRQPLPPFWSLGYITSKYGYHDQRETLAVVDTLKEAGYPLDGIVLDLYWYGKEQDMGRLAWDPEQWPDPKGMLQRLARKGVNLVAISQPYVLRNGRAIDNYNILTDSSMLLLDTLGNSQEVKIWVGEGGMFDVSNPATRRWLADRYHSLTETGITGWWGDLGEPEVHPLSGKHYNGLTTPLYHNQYGNDWSSIISDMFAERYPDRRLMLMMRGGTTGLQRYSVFPWSTDVSRSWGGLEPQIRIMLNSGLSGLGYMGHDIGGFAVDPENAYLPELYLRWLQLGLFSPVLRTHAQQYAEPYHYPMYAREALKIVRERYRWLPYNYTLAWENATKGYPLVRPLNFTDPSARYDSISDEFLWGRDVLVAPVMTEGTTSRSVTFPAGEWMEMDSPNKVYPGHSTATVSAPIDKIPVFVRAGAFIPMADYKMENTGDYNPGRLTVNYYPVAGLASEYTMFDDDRTGTGTLAEGNHRLITFKATDGGRRITVEAHGTYPKAPETIELTLIYHRVDGNAKVLVNGRMAKPRYNAADNTLRLNLRWPVNRPLIIESNNLKLCSQE